MLAVAVGLAVGRFALAPVPHRHLAAPVLRGWHGLAGGLVLALLADRLDGDPAVACAVLGQALLVGGVVANLRVPGTGVLAVGLGLNLAVLAVDGGMPVRAEALVDAGVVEDAGRLEGATLAGPRHLASGTDRLAWLGDAIPVRAAATAVSVGDVVTVAGLGAVAAGAARRRGRRGRDWQPRRPETAAPAAGAVAAASCQAGVVVDITQARPDQDCGAAPPGSAVSGCHHSASPEASAPAAVGPASWVRPARQSR